MNNSMVLDYRADNSMRSMSGTGQAGNSTWGILGERWPVIDTKPVWRLSIHTEQTHNGIQNECE